MSFIQVMKEEWVPKENPLKCQYQRRPGEIGASQRASAKVLGVSAMQVNRDVTKVTPEVKNTIENEEVTDINVTNVSPEPIWMD